jgi:hypothetical protein
MALLTAQTPLPPIRQAMVDRILESVRALVGRATEAHFLDAVAAPTGTLAIAQLIATTSLADDSADASLVDAYARAEAWRADYLATVSTVSAGARPAVDRISAKARPGGHDYRPARGNGEVPLPRLAVCRWAGRAGDQRGP